MKRIRLIFSCILTFVSIILLCWLLFFRDSEKNIQIELFAVPNSGKVVLRGAMVDNQWYNCSDILINKGSWIENRNDYTYSPTDDTACNISLMTGKRKVLVFNAGPDCGTVRLMINSDYELEFNLRQDIENPLGNQYLIEYPYTKNTFFIISNNQAAVLALLFVTLILISVILLFKRDTHKKVNTKKRNSSVEFCRFFAIMCVVVHHYASHFCGGGYLAVDFFSILTGFFLMQHFCKEYDKEIEPPIASIKYIKSRYLRLIPFYSIAFFLGIVISIILNNGISITALFENNIWEVLMLGGFSFSENLIVGPGWYIQSMILSSYICYYFLWKNKNRFVFFMVPIFFLAIFSFIQVKIGHLNHWLKSDEIIPIGTLRVFSEMGLGCLCYSIYIYIINNSKNNSITIMNRLFHTIIECICIIYILYVVFIHPKTQSDFICVLFMATFIVSIFMEKSLISLILNNRISLYLGKISISIYLSHLIIARINWLTITGLSWKKTSLIYVLIVIIFSCISTKAVDCISKADRIKRG